MIKKGLLLAAIILSLSSFSQTNNVWVPYRDGNLWGYADTMGKVKVKPVYDKVDFFETYGQVYKGKNVGLLNASGIQIIAPLYTSIEELEEGFKVGKGNLYGFFSSRGRIIIPVQYDDIYTEDDYLFILKKNGKYGLSSMNGSIILPIVYDELFSNYDNELKYFAKKAGKYYQVNTRTGKLTLQKNTPAEVMPETVEAVSVEGVQEDKEETYRMQVKEKFKADEVVAYESLKFYVDDHYFLVTVDGKKGIVQYFAIDNIMTVVPVEYDAISYAKGHFAAIYDEQSSSYLAAVLQDGKFGIVNESGDHILRFEYDYIGPLKGYASGFELKKDGKKGVYLPTTSYPIIAPKYNAIEYATSIPVNPTWGFVLYKVSINGKEGYVGENGVEYFK